MLTVCIFVTAPIIKCVNASVAHIDQKIRTLPWGAMEKGVFYMTSFRFEFWNFEISVNTCAFTLETNIMFRVLKMTNLSTLNSKPISESWRWQSYQHWNWSCVNFGQYVSNFCFNFEKLVSYVVLVVYLMLNFTGWFLNGIEFMSDVKIIFDIRLTQSLFFHIHVA